MYAFFALSTHDNALVEMVVSDPAAFIDRNRKALEWIANKWGIPSSFCVRGFSANHTQRGAVKNTWRFLESPVRNAEFTYIGDTDIFLTESVLDPKRFLQMIKFRIPYSNTVRGGDEGDKLSGLMLVHTENYYTPQLQEKQASLSARGNDEEFLYRLVNESGHGLIPLDVNDPVSRYRPVHGLHLSFNRGPGKRMCQDPKDPHLCPMLHTPDLENFLCHNPFGYRQLSKFIGIMQRQIASNMTIKNGTCMA